MNAIKISQIEEYINPEKFNGKEFKAYHGWMVEVLSDRIIYIIGTAKIILLLVIQNDCIIYGFDWFIWDKERGAGR